MPGDWRERVSAVALVPLTLWFVASIIPHTSSDYATFIAWLRTPARRRIPEDIRTLRFTGWIDDRQRGLCTPRGPVVRAGLVEPAPQSLAPRQANGPQAPSRIER